MNEVIREAELGIRMVTNGEHIRVPEGRSEFRVYGVVEVEGRGAFSGHYLGAGPSMLLSAKQDDALVDFLRVPGAELEVADGEFVPVEDVTELLPDDAYEQFTQWAKEMGLLRGATAGSQYAPFADEEDEEDFDDEEGDEDEESDPWYEDIPLDAPEEAETGSRPEGRAEDGPTTEVAPSGASAPPEPPTVDP